MNKFVTLLEDIRRTLEEGAKKEFFYATKDSSKELEKAGGIQPDKKGKVWLFKTWERAKEWAEDEGWGHYWIYYVELDPAAVEKDPEDREGALYKQAIPWEAITDWSVEA